MPTAFKPPLYKAPAAAIINYSLETGDWRLEVTVLMLHYAAAYGLQSKALSRRLPMRRAVLLPMLAVAVAGRLAALQLVIAPENEQVFRGASHPVEGLIVRLDVNNDGAIPLLLPLPALHEAAAPTMALKATIVRLLDDGAVSPPVPPVKDLQKGFDKQETPEVRIEARQSKTFRVNIGSVYDLVVAGRYRMCVEYAGERSNEVEFTLLPLRKLEVPREVLKQRFDELERRNLEFCEMFYVLQTARAWDEIVLMYRLARKPDGRFLVRNVGYLPRGTTPKMVMAKPGVYGLLFADRVRTGWRFVAVDVTGDPPAFEFKFFEQPAAEGEPTLTVSPDGKPVAE